MILDGKCPTGPIQQSWDKHRFDMKLVNPAGKVSDLLALTKLDQYFETYASEAEALASFAA